MKPPPERQRAPRGSLGTSILLKLPEELAQQSREAALLEGISLAEWWRRAAQEKLAR